MRKFVVITVLIFIDIMINAQTVSDSVYYQRLYYTAKTWGLLKYFHSEVAKGNKNWDYELIHTLQELKNDYSNQDFNQTLENMINNAGEMAKPTTGLPNVPNSMKYNLDLNWLDHPIFAEKVKVQLDTVKTRFRPQNNFYVGQVSGASNPTFGTDDQFYQWGVDQYPEEEYRLLALFRYWNIINYFYPYKNIIDQNWDSTLVEFIPKIINADSDRSYHLTFLKLATRINDSHAFTYSQLITEAIFGYYYLPLSLKYVENETVITGVFTDNKNIEVGDIIKSFDGLDINTVRDSVRHYTQGSNEPTIERNINTRLLRGQNVPVQMTLVDQKGEKEVTLSRDVYINDYSNLIANKGDIWEILKVDSKEYGYVDMGRLQVLSLGKMFNDLKNTDGIIFDIRNYPQGTMWSMIRYLFDAPVRIANFSVPNIEYPGTIYWHYETVGTGNFSSTYRRRIFILFDENTQSQAEYTVMALEQHPKAVKIGSQTAGADGNISSIYLPGGIITVFTGLGVFYPDFTETQRIGIVPDIEVHPTIAGIRAGRDELLEAALYYTPSHSTEPDLSPQPEDICLFQNRPNPFNSSTIIKFQIKKAAKATVRIFNMRGQHIKTLVDKELTAGIQEVRWTGRNKWEKEVSSGVYLIQLELEGSILTRKILLIR